MPEIKEARLGDIVLREMPRVPNGILATAGSGVSPERIVVAVERVLDGFYSQQNLDFVMQSIEGSLMPGEETQGVVLENHGAKEIARIKIVYYGKNTRKEPLVRDADYPVSWFERVTRRRIGVYINGPQTAHTVAQTRNAILDYATKLR